MTSLCDSKMAASSGVVVFIAVILVVMTSSSRAFFLRQWSSDEQLGDQAADGGVDAHDVDEGEIPQGAASLAFVFDITGSMHDDLVQVIDGAARILATTLARRDKPLFNYVLVPFHDPGTYRS